jgi:hypothetical protein
VQKNFFSKEPKMKLQILGLFLLTSVLTEALPVFVSAHAQDYYDRSNRPRRQQDYNRGYRDGVDCTMEVTRLVDAACDDLLDPWEHSSASDTRARDAQGYGMRLCRNLQNLLSRGDHQELFSQISGFGYMNGTARFSSGTIMLVQRARDCEAGRRESFEEDINRDSEIYHEEQERRRREEEDAQRDNRRRGGRRPPRDPR